MQREADPGHHHRPGFHAAHAVDTLFERETGGQIVVVQRQGFCHFAVDFQRPRIGFETTGVGRRIGLVEAKFVEVVIARHFIFWRKRQFVLPLGGFRKGERGAGRGLRPIVAFKPVEQVSVSRRRERERGGADAKHFQDLAAL